MPIETPENIYETIRVLPLISDLLFLIIEIYLFILYNFDHYC